MTDEPEEVDEETTDSDEGSAESIGSLMAGGMEIRVGSGGAEEDDDAFPELPNELPVLPLKNTVLFPFLLSPLLVNTPASQELIDSVLLRADRFLVCAAIRHEIEGPARAADIFDVGTVLRVVKMLKFPDGSYRLLVQGVARVGLEEILSEEPFLRARISPMDEQGDYESVEVEALTRNLSQQFNVLVAESARLSDDLQVLVANLDDPSKLADLVASNLELDVAGKQEVLEALDVTDRLRIVLGQLTKEGQELEIETEIKEKVQNEMGRTQREYVLRQQLEAIRRELGESEEGEEGAEVFRQKVEAAGLPEEAKKHAYREVERLSQMPPAAAEYGVIRSYLEWITDLPWSVLTEDRLDVVKARTILDEDHYGLEKIKDRIVEYIAVLSLKRDLKGPILCFVGPPGTGKTSLGRSVARALDRKFARISLGGVRDEAEIRGHRRTYVGAMPGRIVQSLRKAATRNPVMLLDELDKVGSDGRGDPSSALLEVLDPEQNSEFSDHYLEMPFDLSQVLFIATANQIDPVPAALRDRMEVIELPGYTVDEKVEIAKRFIVPRQVDRNGISQIDFEISEESLVRLSERYTREAGVRNLEREVGSVCRKIARNVAEGELGGPVRIEPDDLEDLLGPAKFEPEIAEADMKPGVAVGLAWTPSGGDILFVESTQMPGTGELKLTGSLGDVMRESAEAARSWLRSNADDFGLDLAKDFDARDMHVHVPSGGVPKDGPSAGVAMVIAMMSMLKGNSILPNTAMTGEITLRGKVLPVGGIKEKVLAAKRAGIRRVVLPEENRRDVEEIAEGLLDGIELSYVGSIDAALLQTMSEGTIAEPTQPQPTN
ncbi:MAG TPA: endopeptidase La [Myxococcales bacterium]|nr:endopeptidase La [Myxococcales bacterium]HIL79902.1 endopeptidase La [Myxococcales bacterium]